MILKRVMIIAVVLSVMANKAVDDDKFQCYFRVNSLLGFGCVTTDMSKKVITGVRGSHKNGTTNADVLYVEATSFTLHFIPEGIHNQFPNVNALTFNFDKLKEIIEDDLKPFGEKLTYLSIKSPTSDMVIPSNIFASTPNIEFLNMTLTHLKSIASSAFEPLKNLKFLAVDFPCKQGSASGRVDVENLISSLGSCYKKEHPFIPKDRNPDDDYNEPSEKPVDDKPHETAIQEKLDQILQNQTPNYQGETSYRNISPWEYVRIFLLMILAIYAKNIWNFIYGTLFIGSGLFNYIRDKVLVVLKVSKIYRIIKLNNDFGFIQKIKNSMLQVKKTKNSQILNLAENNLHVLIVTNVPQLAYSKILQEIENLPGNKLKLIKARNIFVNANIIKERSVMEEYNLLTETTKVDRIIADSSDFQAIFNISKPAIQCFFVTTKDDENFNSKLSLNQLKIDFQWQDLSVKSQTYLLGKSIIFQEKTFKLSEILLDAESLITPEILSVLCSNNEIRVNCDSNINPKKTVQMKGRDFKFLQNFITSTQNEPSVIFPKFAGNGTTLLTEIKKYLTQKFPLHFVKLINLNDFVKELSGTAPTSDNITEYIAKMLEFNVLETVIFEQKYSKGEVKILFGGFDEISSECHENAIKLFQIFLRRDKNQIFITTQTLQHDFDYNKTHTVIEILEETSQNLTSKRYGTKLFADEISKIIPRNLIDEIHECDANSEEIVLNLKRIKKICEDLSLSQIFMSEFEKSLGFSFSYSVVKWPMEETAQNHLIKSKNESQTYAQLLIAGSIFYLLQTVEYPSQKQLNTLFEVLSTENFKIARNFLESLLKKVENFSDLKSFTSNDKFNEKVKTEKDFLKLCVSEKHFCIYEYFTLLIGKKDLDLYDDVLKLKQKLLGFEAICCRN